MAEWIDFKAARSVASFPQVLSRYAVQLRAVNGDHLRGKCPLPTHRSQESKGSFTVNLPKNIWSCRSDSCIAASGRRGGNILDFVAIMEATDLNGAAVKLMQWHGSEPQKQNAPQKAERVVPEGTPPHATAPADSVNKPLGFELKGIAYHSYLEERRISKETAESFGVGFFPGKGSMAGRVVFPLVENGTLVGYAGRTVNEVTPDNPKWRIPAGLVKSFLYGLDRCDPAKPLILVESCWAVLFFAEQGNQAAAIMGSDLTEAQERSLNPFGTIIVAMDNDDKGREAARKIADRLRGRHKVLKSFLVE